MTKLDQQSNGESHAWKPDAAALALAHIAEFESSHRKVIRGDNVQIAIQERSPSGDYRIRYMSEKNASSIYKSIKAPDFKGEITSIFSLWEQNRILPPVKLVFRPGGTVGPNEQNLFTGFNVEPRKDAGSYAAFSEHISYVMDSNGDKDRFMWKLIAFRYQNLAAFVPSALAFIGKQGAGKSSITRVLAQLLAPYSITLSDPDKFVGKNNACLQGKLFVQAEEMNLSQPEARHHRLMHFINGDILDLEDKFLAQFQTENTLFTAITSNDPTCVRIGEDSRRFAMYQVEDRFRGDERLRSDFFGRMKAELESGGLEALAYDLLHTDLTSFSPKAVPKTKLFVELAGVDADRDPVRSWWRETLERGILVEAVGKSLDWSSPVPKDSLYRRYVGWCEGDGPKSKAATVSKAEWAKQLGRMLPGGLPAKRMMVEGARGQYFAMPKYQECCAFFEERYRQTIDRAPQAGQLKAVM